MAVIQETSDAPSDVVVTSMDFWEDFPRWQFEVGEFAVWYT